MHYIFDVYEGGRLRTTYRTRNKAAAACFRWGPLAYFKRRRADAPRPADPVHRPNRLPIFGWLPLG